MMNFSIVVLFHNNARINLVIDALLRQKNVEDEIIVVNDNSSADYMKILDNYKNSENFYVVNSTLFGNRSHNRNIGAMRAKNPFLLFVDGDIVLAENCLHLLRMTLLSGFVGAFGNIIQGGNTPEQMNLITGLDYLKFLENNPSIEDFYKYNLAYDKRANFITQNVVTKSEWQYYYSGYCAATKEAFFACGMFNESFKGWGAEDVEFGYRLEKQGDIKFITGAYAYHLSHDRDLFKIMQTNKKNLYHFYYQQLCPEIEIFVSFHLNSNILDAFGYIKDKVKELCLPAERIPKCKGEVCILPTSNTHPNGCITYIDDDDNIKRLDLMGIALPFNNNQFDCATLSTDIFCYPEIISVRIIQECYRVARTVKIYKSKQKPRIHWNSAIIATLSSGASGMDRTYYRAYLINDFSFSDMGEYYTVTGGVATKMPNLHIDNLPEIYSNKACNEKTPCLLFDFTNTLSDIQLQEIASSNNYDVKGIYRLPALLNESPILLSKTIYGEMQLLNIPFIYVIPQKMSIEKEDIWWSYKNRNNDRIIVYHV